MITTNKNFVFMAIAKGKETTEGAVIKRYIGVAPVYVKTVNPNKKQMEEIFKTTLENEPEYVTDTDVNGEMVKTARITFIVQPDAKNVGFEVAPMSMSLFVRNQYRYNKDKTKVQVIDKYGRTAWVTIEQAKNNEIPMYANGPANLDKDYRPCYVGEEELTNFLISYLNIPSPMKYNRDEKKWYMVDNPEDSECRLDNIGNFFKGDFSELEQAISWQPNNKVKVMFGVRTSDDNKQYQAVYTQMFLKNGVTDYSKLDANMQERKNNGAYATTEFSICPFKEYTVEETTFKEENNVDPFSSPVGDNPWGL